MELFAAFPCKELMEILPLETVLLGLLYGFNLWMSEAQVASCGVYMLRIPTGFSSRCRQY